jgi:hypothetical protein
VPPSDEAAGGYQASARQAAFSRADGADDVQLCTGGEPALDLVGADRDQVMDALSKRTDKKL